MSFASSKPPSPFAEVSAPTAEHLVRGPALPLLKSEELFRKSREIIIEHGGAHYRLRLTYSNKLILTK